MSIPKKHHHETAPEDRIPIREKLGFAFGTLGTGGAGGVAAGLIDFIFVMTLGMSTKMKSNVAFVQSLGNLILGPIFGQFSDNFRSRWGRRRPLILLMAAPMVLSMAAMYFFPENLSQNGLAIWLLISWMICCISCSLYGLSLNALGIEATGDYHERVRLGFILMLFAMGTGLGIQWIFPFIQLPFFGGTIRGLRIVVGVLTVVFLIASLAPLFFCPEKRYASLSKKKANQGSFIENLRESKKNKPFVVVLSIKFFTFFCYSLVGVLGVYMNMYYMFGGDLVTGAKVYGWLGSSYCIAAGAAVFVYPHIARAWGKKTSLQVAAAILVADCLCKLVVYNPKLSPWWQLIVLMSNGIAVQGINFTIGTMFGDIIDYDELLFGKRREALYASIMGWFEGIGGSIAALLSGYLLFWIGFDAKTGAQPQHTLDMMKFFYFLCPLIGGLFALFMSTRYDLSEERAYEIRDELKRRHAAEDAAENAEQPSQA